MFSRARFLCVSSWWNYSTEQKTGQVLQQGGYIKPQLYPSTVKVFLKKYRRGHFPNRGRSHLNVAQVGVAKQRPHRMHWPYDMNALIFNSEKGLDKIGYVVGTSMKKTAVVAANYMVYYPKYNQRVARTGRYFAHDDDMACVEGDLVHIKQCRKLSKYKNFYVFSILEPNIEGRERLKLGLPVRPPDLFGYPSTRRVMKINLTSKSQSKETLAAAMQEQVSQFYKYGGEAVSSPTYQSGASDTKLTFEDAHKIVAPIAEGKSPAEAEIDATKSAGVPLMGEGDQDYTHLEMDMRRRKGDEYWSKQMPAEGFNTSKKAP